MEARDLDIKQLAILLLKHRYLFIAVIVVVLTVTAAYLYKAPRIYRATAVIEIGPRSENILGRRVESITSSGADYYWANKEYAATQYEIIKSRAVSSKVIESLSQENVLDLLGIRQDEDASAEDIKNIDTVSILQGKISVDPQKNSNIVRIGLSDTDPEVAAFLANSVANSYIEFNIEKNYLATRDAAKWLSEQSINLKKQLEESEITLFNFKKENEVLASAFEERQAMLAQTITEISSKLTEKQIYQKALNAKIEELSSLEFADTEEFFTLDLFRDKPVIQNMKLQYLEIRRKLREKAILYGDQHPDISALRSDEKNIRAALLGELKGILEGYRLEGKTLDNEIRKLQGMLQESQKEALKLNKLEIDYNKLKREVETNKKLYDIVLERTKEADLHTLMRANNIRVIDRALVPKGPVSPRKNLVLLVGLIIAILSALTAVTAVEFFDTRLRDVEDLERIVGRNILGIFPSFDIEDPAKIPEIAFEGSQHSPAVESLRTIRTNIRLAHPDVNAKSILITSSLSQEGKTTVSANIAVSFALAGRRTLLVDTDMRKPRVHKLFGIDNKEGISTHMLGEKGIEQVIRRNVYQGLDVLLCGPIPPNPAEMMESKRFRDMTERLRDLYDIIIFDSPPIIAVSDAAILSSMIDGVVVVVKIRQVSRDILKRSVSQLTKSNALLLGAVVNNLDLKGGGRYGSYYYYYHEKYRYYGEAQEKKPA
ncbi:MAG TPA: polysaccharide biosynthesis tyrosine autokinase [bacterium]|nr:polysaccharide biosynthesis tyrosine autokinase [bacterium]